MKNPSADAKRSIQTIVFVDADRLFREAIIEILRASGYAVHTAQDGLEALTRIRDLLPEELFASLVPPPEQQRGARAPHCPLSRLRAGAPIHTKLIGRPRPA